MNWNQLQYLISVKEEKSISRAAEKLFISQPSLSISIRSLENEIGTPLFERKNGEQVTTEAGELFYEWAKETMYSYHEVLANIREQSARKKRRLRLGISPYRSQLLIPGILDKFFEKYPECEVILSELPTYELRELLEQKALDMIIDAKHPDKERFASEFLLEEKIILAIPSVFAAQLSEKTRESKRVKLEELRDFPFILSSKEQGIGQVSRNICASAGFRPKVRLICQSTANAMQLCANQIGIMFVPELLFSKAGYQGKISFFSIDETDNTRDICFVYERNREITDPMQAMMQFLRNEIGSLYEEIKLME